MTPAWPEFPKQPPNEPIPGRIVLPHPFGQAEPIRWDCRLIGLIEDAALALGSLQGLAENLGPGFTALFPRIEAAHSWELALKESNMAANGRLIQEEAKKFIPESSDPAIIAQKRYLFDGPKFGAYMEAMQLGLEAIGQGKAISYDLLEKLSAILGPLEPPIAETKKPGPSSGPAWGQIGSGQAPGWTSEPTAVPVPVPSQAPPEPPRGPTISRKGIGGRNQYPSMPTDMPTIGPSPSPSGSGLDGSRPSPGLGQWPGHPASLTGPGPKGLASGHFDPSELDSLLRKIYAPPDMANPGKMAKAALAYGLMLGHGPFSEKNGLLGRLLINLILFSKNSGNEEPGQPLCLPYLSLCLAKRAEKSQEILDGIRRSRNLAWDEWMAIIAAAISEAAELSRSFLRALATASQRDIKKIEGLGRAGQGCAQIQAAMLERPITQAMQLSQKSGLCPATVNKALAHLGQLGIIAKLGKEKRNRLFAYKAVLEAMDNPGTERLKIW